MPSAAHMSAPDFSPPRPPAPPPRHTYDIPKHGMFFFGGGGEMETERYRGWGGGSESDVRRVCVFHSYICNSSISTCIHVYTQRGRERVVCANVKRETSTERMDRSLVFVASSSYCMRPNAAKETSNESMHRSLPTTTPHTPPIPRLL